MIPEEKVREVMERLSIVEVVSDYVQLRRAGANYTGLCPFHAEKTPSFNVNPAREIFHCFGCGTGGNAFSFIMKIEGLSFPESVKLLARKAGVEIEERQLTPAEKQAQSERQTFQRINDLAAGYYRTVLEQKPEGSIARSYLEQRTARGEIAETYRLGFAPDRGDGLVQHLKASGIPLETALKLGIIRKSDRGWYDLFRNRLIFPIRDAKGHVIAFAGRVLDASLPKYINSPESPIYHKSSVLFGLDLALPAIRTENSVILVEGYFDHLALYRAGIRNVVATCGTALTSHHAGLIKRHAARVFTLFDSDAAGRKATIRSMELFLEQRLPAYVITLPSGDDPDSFLAGNTVEAFRTCQTKARPAFEFFVQSILASTPLDSVDSKRRIIDEIVPTFKKITRPLERDLYEKEVCRLLEIPIHTFRKALGGITLSSQDLVSDKSHPHKRGDSTQEMMLSLMGLYPEARAEIISYGIDNIFSGQYQEIANFIATVPGDENSKNLQLLIDSLENQEHKNLLTKLLVSEEHLAGVNWHTVLEDCLRAVKKKSLPSIQSLTAKLRVLDQDSAEYIALLHEINDISMRKSKL
ncbi:DNA primase [Geobacter sp. SVR]|uniref:DNA primase n=1 Tax=Geobacter sp. SVR TaxID=2495594 RepID=UPI00143EFA59|nr:DNA primase [Geobacter sp. SVR]BCS52592.1 DNA primase [Geobacter sp. SVR]GCF83970.1 DNA primase [Geobacter sp. SVR]